VANRTSVLLVQHPRERFHPFNTARLLELCLSRVRVLVDHTGTLRRGERPLSLLPGAALLYPGPTARDVSRLEAHERPTELVVIDGTWHQAHTLYRDIPGLSTLPHLTLPAGSHSEFQVRRQPAEHCLSTIEAVYRALAVLEPDTKHLDGLVALFRSMNEDQLGAARSAGRLRKRSRQRCRLPRALAEDFHRLVVAYAETAPGMSGRLLVSLCAERLATGERFDCVLRQTGVADAHLEPMGLLPSELGGGLSPAAFCERWAAFLHPDDVLGVWSHTTLDSLKRLRAAPERALVLKAAYRGLRAGRGGMDEIAALEGRGPVVETRPRRHGRLANAAWVARVLHGSA
jgi:hypothetical protein